MTVSTIHSSIRSALLGKRGAAMIEYALLVGLIAIVAIASMQTLGTSVKGSFSSVATSI